MTTVRTVAVHDVVASAFPRETTDEDRIGMAIGRAIDSTLSHLSHQARIGRRPTASSIQTYATDRLDESLEENGVDLPPADREKGVTAVSDSARAFRRSVLFGLPRPRSRLVLIGEQFGAYAQPDFWDGRSRFYEMKSYLAIPPRPDVALQVRLFQLAFPGFTARLVCIDRHSHPVTTTEATIPGPSAEEASEALRLAADVARKIGRATVLEYVDVPVVRYAAPSPGGAPEVDRPGPV